MSDFTLPNVPLKAYQSITPASNRVLKARWDKDAYLKHRKHVVEAKPLVDADAPKVPMLLHLKLAKLEIEKLRNAKVERQNRVLMERISYTMRSKGFLDNWNRYTTKSLQNIGRHQKLLRISHENQAILKRIALTGPYYDHRQWEKEWRIHLNYLLHMSRYTNDWNYDKFATQFSTMNRTSYYERPNRKEKSWHAEVMDKVKSYNDDIPCDEKKSISKTAKKHPEKKELRLNFQLQNV